MGWDVTVVTRAMDATCGDLPQLLSADNRRTQLPEDAIGDHNDQGWTWREPYGAIHQAECEDCTRYSTHLKEALGNEIPSAIVAVNYPSAMARREFDRGWDAYKRTEVYSDWAVGKSTGLGHPKGLRVWVHRGCGCGLGFSDPYQVCTRPTPDP